MFLFDDFKSYNLLIQARPSKGQKRKEKKRN